MNKRPYIATILLLAVLPANANADQWRIDAPLYLSSAARYQVYGDRTLAYDSMAAMLQVRVSRPAFSAGLFADYRFSTDARFDDIVNLGAVAMYSATRWDHSVYAFVNKSSVASDRWAYFARTRYRLADRHKIGVEAMGLLRTPQASRLMLGYYGSLTGSLSANIAAGTAVGAGPDRAVRVELIWRVR